MAESTPGDYYRRYEITRYHTYWNYAHVDFDGGPWETGGPPMDPRYGTAMSLPDAIDEIDEQCREEWENEWRP